MLYCSKGKVRGGVYIITFLRILVVYLLYAVMHLIYYVYNRDLISITQESLPDLLIGALHFDTSAICYTNALFILLSILPLRIRTASRYQWLVALSYIIPNALAVFVNLSDTVYYRFSGKRTTMSVFTEFAEESWSGLYTQFIQTYWPITLIGVALVAALVLAFWKTRPMEGSSRLAPRLFYPTSVVCMLVIGFITFLGARGTANFSMPPLSTANAALYAQNDGQVALLLNTPYTMIRSSGWGVISNHSYMPQTEAIQWHNTDYSLPDTTALYRGTFHGRNVMVIIWESLSREWVGYFNKDLPGYKGFTPFLDSLCSHSYVFTDAYANGRQSVEAMPSILTSSPTLMYPIFFSAHTYNRFNSLPQLLKTEGYSSAFYHGAERVSMGFAAFSKRIGFNQHYSLEDYPDPSCFDGSWGIYDSYFLPWVAHKQSELKQPFFATLFTLSSHHPYKIPKHLQPLFPKESMDMQRAIRYADYSLKQYFQEAKKQPWYKNTLFVITADHSVVGERPEYKNPLGLYSIPIILFDPQGQMVGQNSTITQHIDIMPMLLSLLGYEGTWACQGNNPMSGRDLHYTFQSGNDMSQVCQDSLLLILMSGKPTHLYDRRHDKHLQHDVLGLPQYAAQADSLTKRAQAFLQVYSKQLINNKNTELNAPAKLPTAPVL